jgi:uncharacterized protein YcgI (DUF1989 family)
MKWGFGHAIGAVVVGILVGGVFSLMNYADRWQSAANDIFWTACSGSHDSSISVEEQGDSVIYTCTLMDSGTTFSLPKQSK